MKHGLAAADVAGVEGGQQLFELGPVLGLVRIQGRVQFLRVPLDGRAELRQPRPERRHPQAAVGRL